MASYDYIIDEMTFSYSRLKLAEQCKYAFFLKYILEVPQEDLLSNFFAEYGTLMHDIIRNLIEQNISNDEALFDFMRRYKTEVTSPAPSYKIYKNYFMSGCEYIENFKPFNGDVVWTERFVEFSTGKNQMVGYIDCLMKNKDGYVVLDHKSHDLKPRSKRSKPTLKDKELDDYLIQLYLYSTAVNNEFNETPKVLEFNCFRNNAIISEEFSKEKYLDALKWADEIVDSLKNETKWSPNIDYYYCNNLCDMRGICEYKN